MLPNTFSNRRRLLGILSLLLAVCAFWMVCTNQAQAYSEAFCTSFYAAPWGREGDRCHASWAQYLTKVHVGSVEHSGCANGLEGNGQLFTSWVCSPGSNSSADLYLDGWKWGNGIIRNNTTGDWTHISGNATGDAIPGP